ncbi:MAG: hypothetical protein ACRENF_03105 [Thermodesulfobacteriota bacterium]
MMDNRKEMLVGMRLKLKLSEPHQYGDLGIYEADVMAIVKDAVSNDETYILKPINPPLMVLNKFKARLLVIGPMGGYKRQDKPIMSKLLRGEHVSVCVNFLEDDSFFKGEFQIKYQDLPGKDAVKFGCYAEAWVDENI